MQLIWKDFNPPNGAQIRSNISIIVTPRNVSVRTSSSFTYLSFLS